MADKKGKWVTIKGRHIFIPEGKKLEDVWDYGQDEEHYESDLGESIYEGKHGTVHLNEDNEYEIRDNRGKKVGNTFSTDKEAIEFLENEYEDEDYDDDLDIDINNLDMYDEKDIYETDEKGFVLLPKRYKKSIRDKLKAQRNQNNLGNNYPKDPFQQSQEMSKKEFIDDLINNKGWKPDEAKRHADLQFGDEDENFNKGQTVNAPEKGKGWKKTKMASGTLYEGPNGERYLDDGSDKFFKQWNDEMHEKWEQDNPEKVANQERDILESHFSHLKNIDDINKELDRLNYLKNEAQSKLPYDENMQGDIDRINRDIKILTNPKNVDYIKNRNNQPANNQPQNNLRNIYSSYKDNKITKDELINKTGTFFGKDAGEAVKILLEVLGK